MTAPTGAPSHRLTIVRRFDAPRELVFEAWTDPKHLHWFAGVSPDDAHPSTVDLRVGGSWRVHLVQPDGTAYMTGGVYHEIVEPVKLVFSWGGSGGWPDLETVDVDDVPTACVLFANVDGATEMTFTLAFAETASEARVRSGSPWGSGPDGRARSTGSSSTCRPLSTDRLIGRAA